MTSNILSFSRNFKIQYFSREKPVRDEIDTQLIQAVKIQQFLAKNEINYQKIKMRFKIKSTCEDLTVLFLPTPRIIVKRLE